MDNSKRSGQETHTPREKVLGYVYRVFSSTTLAARQSLPWKSSWYYQTVLRKAKYCPISTSDHKVQGEISLNAHRKGCIIVHCAFKCHDSCLLNYPSYCEPHYNELQGQPHFFFTFSKSFCLILLIQCRFRCVSEVFEKSDASPLFRSSGAFQV